MALLATQTDISDDNNHHEIHELYFNLDKETIYLDTIPPPSREAWDFKLA